MELNVFLVTGEDCSVYW